MAIDDILFGYTLLVLVACAHGGYMCETEHAGCESQVLLSESDLALDLFPFIGE
eukprot:m.60963 g.60963  ORF g.60963 m.60963 type:complete len:54 (+) comp15742_c0_seq1:106-267(+)